MLSRTPSDLLDSETDLDPIEWLHAVSEAEYAQRTLGALVPVETQARFAAAIEEAKASPKTHAPIPALIEAFNAFLAEAEYRYEALAPTLVWRFIRRGRSRQIAHALRRAETAISRL